MIHGRRIAVVLPAYNAEKTLERTFREVPADIVDLVLLVDDGSHDRTVEVARRLGIRCFVHPENRGYGANQKTCYSLALREGADIVVMLHPDYQYTPPLITPMAAMIASGEFDVVLGSRILGAGALEGGMPLYKFISNRFLTLAQNLLVGSKLSEYHTGFRAFRREVLSTLPLLENSDDFLFDNQMLVQAIRFGFRIGEITCPTRYLEESSSINFRRSVVYGLGVLRTSLQYVLSRGRIREYPFLSPDGRKLAVEGSAEPGEGGACRSPPPGPPPGLPATCAAVPCAPFSRVPPRIVQCADCSIASLAEFPAVADRETAYQEEYYREGSGERFLGLFEILVAGFRRLRVRSIVRRSPGPGAFLDVGCGRGLLPALFRERGWVATGTQLSRTAAEAARRRYGVDVRVGELPELPLPAAAFDVATFFHVLEHLDRPEAYLRKAWELLAPGGLLVVEVPNFASPGFRLLGTRNFCVDFPNHLVFFTPASLERLLRRCGFSVEEVSHFSMEYSPFTTLQNLLNILPGEPGRLYKALMGNEEGRRLRRSPVTWLHAILGCALALPATLLSLAGLMAPVGNTLRFYCRKEWRPQGELTA